MRNAAIRAATAPQRQSASLEESQRLSVPVIAAIVICCAFVVGTIALGVLLLWCMRRSRSARADMATSHSAKSSSPGVAGDSATEATAKWTARHKSWSTMSGASPDMVRAAFLPWSSSVERGGFWHVMHR